MTRRTTIAAVAFGGAVAAAAGIGASASAGPDTGRFYESLDRPSFAPPAGVFGPVWSVLYAGIATAGYRIWRADPSPERTAALRWWGAQLALNTAWTPLFFGRRQGTAALVDVVALDVAIVNCIRHARRVDRSAAALLVPYLLWTMFATALNAALIRRNPSLR